MLTELYVTHLSYQTLATQEMNDAFAVPFFRQMVLMDLKNKLARKQTSPAASVALSAFKSQKCVSNTILEGPLNINARNETMTQSADDIQNLHRG